ncbi:MAG: hypothetical protein JXA96_07025 [Sedimentisphaerales bacterium]|nr:hypothetical protein [Sedimentisphaerales bacterium]
MNRIIKYLFLIFVGICYTCNMSYACITPPVAIISPDFVNGELFGVVGVVGETTEFDGWESSYDPDNGDPEWHGNGISAWSWSFQQYVPKPSQLFRYAGVFDVSLTVTDDDDPSAQSTYYTKAYISEVANVAYWYGDEYYDAGTQYRPLNGYYPIELCANSNPPGHPFTRAYFPKDEPTWNISGPGCSYLAEPSGYCYGGSSQDQIVLWGFSESGVYNVEAEAGTSDDDINVVVFDGEITGIEGTTVNVMKYDEGGTFTYDVRPDSGWESEPDIVAFDIYDSSYNLVYTTTEDYAYMSTSVTIEPGFYWPGYSGYDSVYDEAVDPGKYYIQIYVEKSDDEDTYYYYSVPVEFYIIDVKLKEVSFTGTSSNMHTVYKNNMTGSYSAPHWLDNEPDGNPEREYPISFERDTTMKVSTAKWYVNLPNGTNVKIKGEGPDGMNFPDTSATVSSNQITISDVTCTNPFPETVCFYNPMEINWKFSIDGGSTWLDAGTSENQTYITLDGPNTTLLHDLVHLSCKSADGQTTQAGCVNAIWNDINDCNVCRIDGTKLTYWGSPYTSTNTQQLLVNGYGDCEAWSHFFIDMLKVQGIGGATMVEVQESSDPTNIWLLIKNWTFTGDGVLSPDDFAYVIGVDVSDATGVEGQGDIDDPPSKFQAHCIVKYSGKYYDPSYGKGPYDNQPAWENDSLAGLRKYGLYEGVPNELVKKNDPETTETTFTE